MASAMRYDLAIIGGGIVGLATALRLSSDAAPAYGKSLRIVVLEKEAELALHQTGHNSGVIHSGIYYAPGSLKARNCIEGYKRLLAFLKDNDIPHRLCGKVIVATRPEEVPALDRIYERGRANGLKRIRKIGPDELREIEPHVQGVAGIAVPYAGIVDYRRVAESYARIFRAQGGEIRTGTRVTGFHRHAAQDSVRLRIRVATPGARNTGESEDELEARLVVNCAGLYSDTIAEAAGQANRDARPGRVDYRIIPFRGEYYTLRPEKRHLVKSLIYPVPDPAFPFLGVHFTSLIDGGVEAGPNAVFALHKEGYRWSKFSVGDVARSLAWPGFRRVARKYWRTGLGEIHRSLSKAAFTRALQQLIPEIQARDLQSGGSGVRAQACSRSDGLIDDFYFHEEPGFVHVGNAPSPAATSSLAIGESIADLVRSRLNAAPA